MRRNSRTKSAGAASNFVIPCLLLAVLAGCDDDDGRRAASSGGTEPPPPQSTTPPPEPTVARSTKANVRFKRATRIRNDFAQALGLPPEELCRELGQYSCTDDVHRVALGEAAPYEQGIYEPASQTGATAPLIVERVALSACAGRVDLDLGGAGDPLIFIGLAVDSSGNLQDPKSAEATDAIRRLYQRFMLRNPRQDELDGFVALHGEIAAATPSGTAREWATLSCFAVATSLESVFY